MARLAIASAPVAALRFAGVGGFMNIAQSARRLVFCCTFRAGDLEVAVENGNLRIVREGKHAKFVRSLDQVSFHVPSALARGQEVLYVTERAVFELTAAGLRVIEVAPGIDLQNEMLSRMEFVPQISTNLRPMPLFASP